MMHDGNVLTAKKTGLGKKDLSPCTAHNACLYMQCDARGL